MKDDEEFQLRALPALIASSKVLAMIESLDHNAVKSADIIKLKKHAKKARDLHLAITPKLGDIRDLGTFELPPPR